MRMLCIEVCRLLTDIPGMLPTLLRDPGVACPRLFNHLLFHVGKRLYINLNYELLVRTRIRFRIRIRGHKN
jgi:hypothetical protein